MTHARPGTRNRTPNMKGRDPVNTLLLAALTIAAPVALALALREAWRQYRDTFPPARSAHTRPAGTDVSPPVSFVVLDEAHYWTPAELERLDRIAAPIDRRRA